MSLLSTTLLAMGKSDEPSERLFHQAPNAPLHNHAPGIIFSVTASFGCSREGDRGAEVRYNMSHWNLGIGRGSCICRQYRLDIVSLLP